MVVPRDSDMEFITRQVTEVLSREIEITWRKLFDADPDPNLRVFLISESTTARHLAAAIEGEVNCQVTVVDPYARIDRAMESEARFPLSVAEGLALRKLLPQQTGGINFLGTHSAAGKAHPNIRKELATCAGLLAVIATIWIGGLFLQMSRLESEYDAVKTQIQDIFRETLPEEKNMVHPLAQLQQKLDAWRGDSSILASFQPGQMTPLDILSTLSTHQPPGHALKLSDLFIAADSVRVTGNCNSFSTLSEWQHTLKQIPGFDIVDVTNPKKDAKTGQVHFTLSLSSGRTVQ
jgi:Tfp pilus assembly protein PilN